MRSDIPVAARFGEKQEDRALWARLWARYGDAPSIAFCRRPEISLAGRLRLEGETLDHCCGDGQFAELAWPGRTFSAGCDLQAAALEAARGRHIYGRLDQCDASRRLPYADRAFDGVFDNSALEHIPDLDGALAEVARVTRPGGLFAFNVLNRRYLDWWPLGAASRDAYCRWQPFCHALTLSQWTERLRAAGFELDAVDGYFDRKAARTLAYLEYEFSGAFMGQRDSRLVRWYSRCPWAIKSYWKWRLSGLSWITGPDEGAGFFIKAVKRRG